MRKLLADNFDGKSLGRLNDLIADKKGGVYFNGAGTYYVNRDGKVSSIGDNIRTNGITLSRDEKTLYVTNGGTLVAFDVAADGSVKNQRDFAKLEAGGNGDGMAIDAEGRLYVTSGPGVQVFSADGKYLGVIPTPRSRNQRGIFRKGQEDVVRGGCRSARPGRKRVPHARGRPQQRQIDLPDPTCWRKDSRAESSREENP